MNGPNEGLSLRDYLTLLRRRARLILLTTLLTSAAVVGYSLHQAPLYAASAQVYVKNQGLVLTQGVLSTAPNTLTADRSIQTQAMLARTVTIASLALKPWARGFTHPVQDGRSISSLSPQDLLNASTVSPDVNADILTFRADDGDQKLAIRLANGYAAAYVYARNTQDQAAFLAAKRETEAQISSLQGRKAADRSVVLTQLLEQAAQYSLEAHLAGTNAVIAQTALHASKIRPAPFKSGLLGLLLGLGLGLGAALVANTLDTRLRSADNVSEILELPLLGRIPGLSTGLRRTPGLASVLEETTGAFAESYRKLRTNLDFANIRPQAKTMVITSAIPREGKTTTACNLAITLAQSGRRVILVDMDLRRPMVGKFFGIGPVPGLADLLLARASLSDVLIEIPINPPQDRNQSTFDGNTMKSSASRDLFSARLEILTCSEGLPRPADLMSSPRMEEVLTSLRKRADVVVIDSAPLLPVSDTLELATFVDALLIVAQADLVRPRMLAEVQRLVESLPCERLGFILTNADAEDDYGYVYGDFGSNGRPSKRTAIRARIARIAPSPQFLRRKNAERR